MTALRGAVIAMAMFLTACPSGEPSPSQSVSVTAPETGPATPDASVSIPVEPSASVTEPATSEPVPTPAEPVEPSTSAVPTRTVWFEEVPPLHASVDDYPHGTAVLRSPAGEEHQLAIRIADTPARRQHGLMEVPDLPDGAGMGFVFQSDTNGAFWMKGTLIPLDIAYIAADASIVSIHTMTPCTPEEEAEFGRCPSTPAAGPYRTTLEVPAGFYERIGLDATWSISLTAA